MSCVCVTLYVPLFWFPFLLWFCSQKKWKHFLEAKGDYETEGDLFHRFNKSVKQETNLIVTLPEDPRTRRRRLYKLASEPKVKFPYQGRNFYSQTCDNKEVVKALSLLSNCCNQVKLVSFFKIFNFVLTYSISAVLINIPYEFWQELKTFIEQWSQFKILWENDTYEKKDVNNINLLDSETAFRQHYELENELKLMADSKIFGAAFVIAIGKLSNIKGLMSY